MEGLHQEHQPQVITITLDQKPKGTLFSLKRREGYLIKDLINERCDGSLTDYCNLINIQPPNLHSVTTGGKQCSLEYLNKILSGIRYEAQVSTVLVIRPMETTPGVDGAPYLTEGDIQLLALMEAEKSEKGVENTNPQSSSSDLTPETQKTQQELDFSDMMERLLKTSLDSQT